MEIDELLEILMGHGDQVAYQRAQLEFQELRESDNFVDALLAYISAKPQLPTEAAIFLLTEIKGFAATLSKYEPDVQYEFLMQIHEVVLRLQQSEFFDLAVETLYIALQNFRNSDLERMPPSELFVSAFARLAKARISTRKQFGAFFQQHFALLLNADGVYGLIDALEPVPPVSYGECLGTVLDAVLSEEFTHKNNKLLRVICLAASKMRISQRTIKENTLFFEALRSRNNQIQEFCYSRIELGEFVCDNLLILTYLIKLNFEFAFANLQQLLSFCIMIFRQEFKDKYNELPDFEYTSDFEFMLEEYSGLIGAAAGLFLEICGKLQEEELYAEIEDKEQKLTTDKQNFFVESLEIVLLTKAYRQKNKDTAFHHLVFQLIEMYASLLDYSVLTNTWANWSLQELFEHVTVQPEKYNYIIPIINSETLRLSQMTSKLQICFSMNLIFDRLQEIYTEKPNIDNAVIAALGVRELFSGFAYILINIQEQHYLFQKALDAVKMLIELVGPDKMDIVVEFGNDLIIAVEGQADRFSKLLDAIMLVFQGNPLLLSDECGDILLEFVEAALHEFSQRFTADQYNTLHGCSQAVQLLVVTFIARGQNLHERLYLLYEEFWYIMTVNREYFAECIEGVLTLTRFLGLDRQTIAVRTEYEPFKVLELMQLCIGDSVQLEDTQREIYIDMCEFPVNWVLLVLAFCAKKCNAEELYNASALLYAVEDGPKGALADCLNAPQLVSDALRLHNQSRQPATCLIHNGMDAQDATLLQAINYLCQSRAIRVEDTSVFEQLFYQGQERLVNDILERVVV